MQTLSLTGTIRETVGKNTSPMRKAGFLPATVYSKGKESTSLSVELSAFEKVYTKAGETGLIELAVDTQKLPVLIHNVQLDPVSEQILHVEFLQVDLRQKVKTNVPLVLIGEAPVATEKKGALLTLLQELAIEALPANLPEKLEIDITSLTEVGQELKASSVIIPQEVTLLTDPDTLVVKVSELVSKEAEAEVAAEAAQAATTEASENKAPDALAQEPTPAKEQ